MRANEADRLLSDTELNNLYCQDCTSKHGCNQNCEGFLLAEKAIKVQDAKTAPIVRKETDEEWVKWGYERCPHYTSYNKSNCSLCFDERKDTVEI